MIEHLIHKAILKIKISFCFNFDEDLKNYVLNKVNVHFYKII